MPVRPLDKVPMGTKVALTMGRLSQGTVIVGDGGGGGGGGGTETPPGLRGVTSFLQEKNKMFIARNRRRFLIVIFISD